MLHSLSLPSYSPSKSLQFPDPPYYLKFHTTNQQNIRYLKAIGVLPPDLKPHKLPSSDTISRVISTLHSFKSRGFKDSDFPRLTTLCPELLSPEFDFSEIEPLFEFLASDLNASAEQSRAFIINCPQLMLADVDYCLTPTLDYLRKLKVPKLNVPSKSNSHLLNTRVAKLESKIEFLRSVGFSHEEAAIFGARIPAMFRYSVENNLRPKLEYLLWDMGRSMEELKAFPQYFGFGLRTRIVPRHLHLKEKGVKVKLNRMLMWSDERFYTKWK